ncbi:MAG TPA: proton-conducting transporter membrane subunit, partial [Myxococcaceae bacterium]|nr:proton-conducting transporter membrane subunit [Myxococcaceae bacterium]
MDLISSLQQLVTSPPFKVASLAESLWLIIALPLLGAFVCGVFGKMMGRANTHWVACGAVAGSFLLSLLCFWALASNGTVLSSPFQNGYVPYSLGHDYGTWFAAGDFRVNFGLVADRLSVCLLLVITGVGFLIHLYSTEYMSHDDGYWRFFAYLNLFVAMMLTLVLADSLVLLFVGWEGVGLCSYLLIGFWYSDSEKAYAGRKAFVTNRVGDFGVLLGMFLLVLLTDG